MVDAGEEKGTIDEEEKNMINNVFEFNDKVVSEIMIPRTKVFAVEMDMSISEVIEEIVGEIYDEYDEVEKIIEQIDENTFLFTGNIAIYEVEDILDIKIEERDYDTLSGYLAEELGKIPTEKDKGAIIETEKVVYKIEMVKNKQIIKVKACKIEDIGENDD